jgi:alanine racemase
MPKIGGKYAKIHIKVETGTSRQGIEGAELSAFVRKATKNKNIKIEGIYTHYANIEDTTDPSYAMGQLKRFNENLAMLDKEFSDSSLRPWSDRVIKHSACSPALINNPATQFDMVRGGISMYGMWSSSETKLVAGHKTNQIKLKPALVWKTQIAQIKNAAAGSPISYGLTEKVKRDSRLAILPIGYWDGFDRGFSSIGEVLIAGTRAKVLGRVCMNMTIVDITDIPAAKLYGEVVILGRQKNEEITAEELAKKISTINYEITTRINPLLPRVIK